MKWPQYGGGEKIWILLTDKEALSSLIAGKEAHIMDLGARLEG
jgi:hypothetical protein